MEQEISIISPMFIWLSNSKIFHIFNISFLIKKRDKREGGKQEKGGKRKRKENEKEITYLKSVESILRGLELEHGIKNFESQSINFFIESFHIDTDA